MNDESMAAATGMARGKKKTRRGGRKGKKHQSPQHHHQNLSDAMKKGDHQSAKAHAFALIKSLPAQDQNAQEDDAQPAVPSPALASPVSTPAGDPRTRLALALRSRKKSA